MIFSLRPDFVQTVMQGKVSLKKWKLMKNLMLEIVCQQSKMIATAGFLHKNQQFKSYWQEFSELRVTRLNSVNVPPNILWQLMFTPQKYSQL